MLQKGLEIVDTFRDVATRESKGSRFTFASVASSARLRLFAMFTAYET